MAGTAFARAAAAVKAAQSAARGDRLTVGGADGLVAVYDKRGKMVREIAAGEGIRAVAFAPKTKEV